MRKIERSNTFKKDYKRLLKGSYQSVLGEDLVTVLKLLVSDKPLDEKYRDHELIGNWKGHRLYITNGGYSPLMHT